MTHKHMQRIIVNKEQFEIRKLNPNKRVIFYTIIMSVDAIPDHNLCTKNVVSVRLLFQQSE